MSMRTISFILVPTILVPLSMFLQGAPLWAWLLFIYSLSAHFRAAYIELLIEKKPSPLQNIS